MIHSRPRPARAAALLVAALAGIRCSSMPDADEPIAPPPTRTVDQVDTYGDVTVPDPYRWLEDIDSDETAAWVAAQNAVTERFLAGQARREALRRRLTELWDYPRRTPPARAGSVWYWQANDGLQDQAVLYVADRPDGEGRVLLDPNAMAADGTVALVTTSFARDGSLVAYAIQRGGSDWTEWRVADVATGRRLDDHLEWTKFTGAAWTHDNLGFFYQRYPAPADGETYSAKNVTPELCYHRIGTAQGDDEVVYRRPDEPSWGFLSQVTEDGRYLVVTIWTGTDRRNRIAYVDLEDRAAGLQPLLMDFDAAYGFVVNRGRTFYFQTDLDAPRGRVIAIDLDRPRRADWRVIVEPTGDTLESAGVGGDRLLLTYLRDAHHLARVHDLDGALQRELPLPSPCSVFGFAAELRDDDVYFTVNSFTLPGVIYRYELAADRLSEWWRPPLRFDPRDYVTEQVFCQSRDGTRVPIFLVHRRGLVLGGDNPTFLYGYGGFGVSLTPAFSAANIAWLELGGVYAQVNLRGGGEYGEEWHRAGMLGRKQNVFDDFIAAAEYLIRNRYTSPARLGIGGGSNGGLLVGAAMTQRPDLFAAAIPQVGVLDMLRYHQFTIGWAWASEYGTADDPQMLPVLLGYSPLHNLRPGTAYPATLVMTGDHDDRVLPAHSYKFTAALQAAQAGPAPVLARIDVRSGHGAGKPTGKQIAAAADSWTFLAAALGVDRR